MQDFQLFASKSWNFLQQALRLFVNHPKSVFPESNNNSLSGLLTNAGVNSTGEIALNAIQRRGQHGHCLLYQELAAIEGMLLPAPFELQGFIFIEATKGALDRDGLILALNLEAGDHKTALSFVVDDTLQQTCQCRCSFSGQHVWWENELGCLPRQKCGRSVYSLGV